MLTKLQQMDEDRRNRLINAVIDEFSIYPFEKASTNSIVKKAGISKGLLFHYFEDKKDLYNSTSDYVIRLVLKEFTDGIDWETSDIFERLKGMMLTKIEIGIRHPGLFDFMMNLFKNGSSVDLETAKEIYRKNGLDVDDFMSRIYSENIDFSLFNNPARIGEYIEIINWTLEGMGKKMAESGMLNNSDDTDSIIISEFEKYASALKEAFYKKRTEESI